MGRVGSTGKYLNLGLQGSRRIGQPDCRVLVDSGKLAQELPVCVYKLPASVHESTLKEEREVFVCVFVCVSQNSVTDFAREVSNYRRSQNSSLKKNGNQVCLTVP